MSGASPLWSTYHSCYHSAISILAQRDAVEDHRRDCAILRAVHRVVIVGGGFGGLYAAKALRNIPVEVTLVDRRNFHLFQPLLYQVATGSLSPGEIAAPLRSLLRDQQNVRVLLGDAVHLDAAGRSLILSRRRHSLRLTDCGHRRAQ